MTAKRRVLSGIQPSGTIHLGNYLGMIRQAIELADTGEFECFYFLANYHAMTTMKDGEVLRKLTFEAAADILAVGLDPNKAFFFRQSDVPEVCELTWVFNCVINKSLLDLAHSYKDKVARGIDSNMGLYDYPVLMASDILIYKSHLVPIGRDQKQHLEMTREIARRFNTTYGECFPLPDARFTEGAKVPGTTWDFGEDGKRKFSKMSKSYGNHIEILRSPAELKKKVMGIETDSIPLEAPKNPDNCIIFALFSLLADEGEREELAERYRAGGFGYGEAKKILLTKLEDVFGPHREKRAKLVENPGEVEEVLRTGAARAREVARSTLEEVRERTGLTPHGR